MSGFPRAIALLVLSLLAFIQEAKAQETIPDALTWPALDGSWKNTETIVNQTHGRSIYGFFSEHSSQATSFVRIENCTPKPADDEWAGFDDPNAKYCEPEAEKASQQPAYGIFPLSSEEAQGVFTRLIAYQNYMADHSTYTHNPRDTPTSKEITLSRDREHRALSELLMLNLRLYFADTNLGQRCQRIGQVADLLTRFNLVAGQSNGQLKVAAGQGQTSVLTFALDDVINPVKSELKNPRVCQVTLQGSRSRQETEIRVKVAEKLEDKVTEKLTTYTGAAASSTQQIEALRSQLEDPSKFPIRSREIFKLGQDLSNIHSNLELITADEYRVRKVLAESAGNFNYAGCAWIKEVGDLFGEAFRISDFDAMHFAPQCGKPIGSSIPSGSGQGYSPSTIKVASQYITEASTKSLALVEDLIRFINEKMQTSPAICGSQPNCLTACKHLDTHLQIVDPSDGRSRLMTMLAARAPSNMPEHGEVEASRYLNEFEAGFNNCLDELAGKVKSKNELSSLQKQQVYFSRALKELMTDLTK